MKRKTHDITNLSKSLINAYGNSTTIIAKLKHAKQTTQYIEPLVTLGRKHNLSTDPAQQLHYYRLILSRLNNDKVSTNILIKQIAPAYLNREGGYLRLNKYTIRQGDQASTVEIRWS